MVSEIIHQALIEECKGLMAKHKELLAKHKEITDLLEITTNPSEGAVVIQVKKPCRATIQPKAQKIFLDQF